MKKQNMVRNLFMIALLIGGIFAAGAENSSFAQDRGGVIMIGGGRTDGTGVGGSGCCASTANSDSISGDSSSDGGGALGSGANSANGGSISGGSPTQKEDGGKKSESLFDLIIGFFF